MFDFTTRRLFLFPSCTIDVKEQQKLDKFLIFLEHSGVSKILNQNNGRATIHGGRPTYNPCHMFAMVLYGFAFGKGTLRDLEASCRYDLRYIYLMDQEQPSFKTISNFINALILPNREILFYILMRHTMEVLQISLEDVFIDGTKIEADANKYKFVWKPTKFHERLSDKIRTLLKLVGMDRGIPEKGILDTKFIAGKLLEFHDVIERCSDDEKKMRHKQYEQLKQYLEKSIEYEEKERICGPNRNSYYKTDHDATAMTLKTDYYSGLGSNMHAAYNVQIAVAQGIAVGYLVTQSRNDLNDLIPLIDKIHEFYGIFPARICADSGYGNLENYRYIRENGIENYIKHQSWQGNISGRRPDRYRLKEEGVLECLNGNIGHEIEIPNRHTRKSGNKFYKVAGCDRCDFSVYCKQWQKNKDEDFKIFELNEEMVLYKQEAEENLLSVKGIEMRVNRNIQVEGTYGVVKQDMGYTRFRRTHMDRVTTEMMLMILGFNIRKLFRSFEGKWRSSYWKAPEDIEPEKFKKPSAKRLTNRVNKRKNRSKNEEAKKSYKYKEIQKETV